MTPIRSTLSFIGRSFLPIKSALCVDDAKKSVDSFKKIVKDVYKRPRAERVETFEAALTRLSLTEEDLKARYQDFQQLFYLFSLVTICLFFYAFYMLFLGFVGGCLLSLAVCTLAGLQAFKRHFWMFQVRQRKLGCTVREWWQSI